MIKKEFKIYDDGAEFLDDVFTDMNHKFIKDLTPGMDKEQFSNYTYNQLTYQDNIIMQQGKYNLYEVGSTDNYLINNEKTMYEWYKEWEKYQ